MTIAAEPAQQAVRTLNLRSLLEEMIERGASDLHVTAGERPKLRVDGHITDSVTDYILTPKDTLQLTYSILTENQKKRFETEDELDFSFGIQNLARFRGNVYRQRGCVALAIRQIPFKIQTFEELRLPAVIQRFAEKPRGLVLVTGPTGSGKSTTLAAIIDKINKERRGHILTIEDPIEFIHRHQGCMVNQREVGSDTQSFGRALKYALRQDPDVILVGEMRDLETVSAALTIAETGHLCLATLHTNSAAETINRVIDVFPAHQQSQIRAQLAFVLEGVVTQQLLHGRRGDGVHTRHPRLHPRRQGAPDLLDHAGRQEARDADAERLAEGALPAARGHPGGGGEALRRPQRVPADGRRADLGLTQVRECESPRVRAGA
jgi:twitching motility protein PilT